MTSLENVGPHLMIRFGIFNFLPLLLSFFYLWCLVCHLVYKRNVCLDDHSLFNLFKIQQEYLIEVWLCHVPYLQKIDPLWNLTISWTFFFFFNVLLLFLFSHVSATVDHAVYHIQRDEGEIQQSSLAWCCFQVWFAASFPSKQPSRWYGKIQKLWTWGSHPSFGQKWIWSSRGWLDILAAQHCHCRR